MPCPGLIFGQGNQVGKREQELRTLTNFEILPDWLKIKTVADLLNISPKTVLKMIRCGRFRESEVFQPVPNGRKLISKLAVLRVLQERPIPEQKTFVLTGRVAENALNYELEDALAGIRYAPYTIK